MLTTRRANRTATTEQASLAQSAERLHGKYLARIGVLSSEDKGRQQPECSELDALESGQVDLRSVTEVTLLLRVLAAPG
jgi:hypothetical protein